MKKVLICFLLVSGCSVFTLNLDLSYTFPESEREAWCLEECEEYDYPDLILAPMLIAGYESPECICMTDCMKDSTYCTDSNKL